MIFAVASVLILSNSFGRVEVSTVGAQVLSYVPADGGEVLFMPADRDFSRNREMHGGIPVCWPWFGRFGEPGSRMHGLARYQEWRVEEQTNSRVIFSLKSSEATRTMWPYDFKLHYTVDLGERLRLSLVAMNTSKEAFSVTEGFHPYFRTKDVSRTIVKGLKSDLKVHPGIDGGHDCTCGGAYRLMAGEGGEMVEITSNAECKLVVWNPGPDWPDWDPEGNLGRDDWRKFVCVEPTVIGRENAITICPNECATFTMTIRRCGGASFREGCQKEQ